MEVLYAICCRLDVHKASVTACLRSPGAGAPRPRAVRTFGTTTRALRQRVDWLTTAGGTHVAMESTGVYWRPNSQNNDDAPSPQDGACPGGGVGPTGSHSCAT